VGCSGLPETLAFSRVPAGLSAQPVFSVDTRSPEGGTFDVTLTYLAWGFDWQADYVATLSDKPSGKREAGALEMRLLSWLTLVNDNGQSFDSARLQIIAGRLNVESDYRSLADPPVAEGLYLNCYPLGPAQTAFAELPPPAPPPLMYAPAPAMAMEADQIVVTGMRREERFAASPVVTAEEEDLGDLKLFRVPERVDVSAKGMKQVAFLDKDAVKARQLYQVGDCDPWDWVDEKGEEPRPATLLLVTKNEEAKGLGIALPQGPMALYEPSSHGDLLAGRVTLRDYARGQDIELELGPSAQVFVRCGGAKDTGMEDGRKWTPMRARITNANTQPISVRLQLGYAGEYDLSVPGRKVALTNGYQTVEVSVPGNSERSFDWKLRDPLEER
jgi:hypothetical protein